jgi:hypothetical protein
MKTTILTAALFIVITIVSGMSIPDSVNVSPLTIEQQFRATIVQPGTHMINFRVSNPESDKVVMKIYNEKKVKVFHRATKKNVDLSIKCDMTNCDSGIYTCVIIRNGQEELRKQFMILN